MKKIVLLSLLIGMMGVIAFIGCEKPEPIDPTNGQPQRTNEDSLINQQGDTLTDIKTVEHWRAVKNGYYNNYDGTFHRDETYTYAYLDIYPQDSILYAVDLDTADFYGLAFNNSLNSPYSMNGDTITVDIQYEIEIPEYQRRWLVFHTNDTVMFWRYLGTGIQNGDLHYTFYLIGVE